jgi:hypothetical protein
VRRRARGPSCAHILGRPRRALRSPAPPPRAAIGSDVSLPALPPRGARPRGARPRVPPQQRRRRLPPQPRGVVPRLRGLGRVLGRAPVPAHQEAALQERQAVPRGVQQAPPVLPRARARRVPARPPAGPPARRPSPDAPSRPRAQYTHAAKLRARTGSRFEFDCYLLDSGVGELVRYMGPGASLVYITSGTCE